MAIKKQHVRDYWPRYRRNIGITLTAGYTTATIVTYATLVGTGIVPLWQIDGIIVAAIISLTFLIFYIITAYSAMQPVKILTDAITHRSGERTVTKPPHPNDDTVIQTGLRPLLDVIYEQPDVAPETAELSKKQQAEFDLASPLADTSVGLAILKEDGTVLYHNGSTPIQQGPEGRQTLKLEFYTDQTLQEWIDECKERSVRADTTWTRIPSGPAGESDRTIYDISASYRKGTSAPIIVFLFDRTNTYIPEENDLNFIAFAAHELRGPITVIRGYLDTLIDEVGDTISKEQRELFDRLVVSANRLASYVNNILNSARYDQRHLQLNLHETRIIDIYATVADDMALRASAQHRVLNVDLSPDLPTVAADIGSTSEVFSNLIDNALKYSNEGGIVKVTAEVKENTVEVSVVDNGIGMPSNVIGNLFHKFYRSHRSRETVAGTGIGLYISKAIIESHGGTMQVRSVEGEGSTFSFTLPIYATVAEKLAKADGTNKMLINHSEGWIKNHGEIRG